MDEYGDLRDVVFKIKRRGARGSLQTTYDILPANSNIYKEEIYKKDFSCFNNFDTSKHSYFIKTGETANAISPVFYRMYLIFDLWI